MPSFRRLPVPGTVIVTPDGGTLIATAHAAWVPGRLHRAQYPTLTSTYTLACSYTGQVTALPRQHFRDLAPDEAITVHVYYQTGNLALSGNTITLDRRADRPPTPATTGSASSPA
ncbi:MAG: hypothetical protein IPG75_17230 [Gemmatimonadetes bacterium]|nr:hypothetical protein [Gemmatimonadota bacterium]